MNLTAMRDAARLRSGISDADPVAQDATMTMLVNEALRTVEAESPDGWEWARLEMTVQTQGGVAELPLLALDPPVVFSKVQYCWITFPASQGRDELERRSRRQQLDEYGETVPSLPRTWSVDGTQIRLAPVPDDIYDILVGGVATEPDLVVATDAPTYLPERFHPAVVHKAAHLLLLAAHQGAEATAAGQEYQQWVHRMMMGQKMYRGAGSATWRADVDFAPY